MTTPPHPSSNPSARASPLPVATTVAVLQAMLVLNWTLYALFLPSLAAQAGLAAGVVVWLLLGDQLLFAAGDWAAGLWADRLRRALVRIAPLVIASALLSAFVLGALPSLAAMASPGLLAGAALLWAAASSMLRAPVFALIGRVGGAAGSAAAVHVALVGVALASAAGPLLTRALQGVDPRWPLALASLALVAAAWPVLRLEPSAGAPPAPAPGGARRAATALAAAMFCAALAVQLHAVLMPQQLAADDAWRVYWAPLFWGGFAIGLAVGTLPARHQRPARWDTAAFTIGAVAIWLASFAPLAALPALRAAALAVAGGCWAVAFAGALAAVLRFGRDGGLAAPVGILVSSVALAAAARLLLVGTDWVTLLPLADLALAAWIAGGAGVVAVRGELARLQR